MKKRSLGLIMSFLISMLLLGVISYKYCSTVIFASALSSGIEVEGNNNKLNNEDIDIKEEPLKEANTVFAQEDKYDNLKKPLIDEKEMQRLKDGVVDIIGSNINNFGVAFYDITTGGSFDINGDEVFTAASTVKVPIAMATVNLADKGKLSIDKKVTYKNSDYEEGAGILAGSKKLKSPMAITELIKYSIIYSDNIATNMLIRTITEEERYNFIEDTVKHPVDRESNTTSAKDSVIILKRLYENKENNPYYSTIIDNMKNTVYHDRIDKYIPKEIVAHKIGDYGSYANDIAIIYDDKPYIITVFSKKLGEEAYDTIAKISKFIYYNRK